MTAATAPPRSAPPRARRVPPAAGAARLLRIELRRSPMLWLLPLLAVLFYVSTYRPAMQNPPFWNIRASFLQSHTMLVFAPLLAGMGAWAGSRDGRRGLVDLVGVTAVPRWAGQIATWAAAAIWAELLYLAGVAVVYGVTAHQGASGGPLWWPVAVGAANVAASCALGFAAGSLLPGRFTSALAALVVFLALAGGAFALQDNQVYAQIWPLNVQGPFPPDTYGIFYPYLPDLAIAQLMFLVGLAAAALGALGLAGRAGRAGGRRLRAAAAAVTVAGLTAGGTAVGLAGTDRVAAHGVIIPALHDAASDRPTPYTPVCSHGAVPVCLQPAYRSLLPEVTAALGPLLGQMAGLSGAPVRVTQVAVTSVQPTRGNGINFGGPVTGGRPPVLYLPLSGLTLPGEGSTHAAEFTAALREQYGPMIVNELVGLPAGTIAIGVNDVVGPRHAAQFAVAQALDEFLNLNAAPPPGTRPPGHSVPARAGGNGAAAGGGVGAGGSYAGAGGTGTGARGSGTGGGGSASGASRSPVQMRAAVDRFAALPAAARHAWLAAHLAALRAGRVTLSEIP
jgi:hypothetical protein